MQLTRFRVENLHGQRTFNVSFEDNCLVLVGENGTGKSTLSTLVYYFLTKQWSRLRQYRFDALEATIDGDSIRVTPEMVDIFKKNKRLWDLRHASPFAEETLAILLRDHSWKDVLEDRHLLLPFADALHVPTQVARDYILRAAHDTEESPALKAIEDRISASVKEQILFLPTYRRIEQDLKAIFPGIESELRKIRERLAHSRTSRRFLELVEFGMEDVEQLINTRMEQIKENIRNRLNNLTGTYLRDVIRGIHTDIDVVFVRDIDPATLQAFFQRIDEEILPKQDKKHLTETVERINLRGSILPEERVVAHFLLRLYELYQGQQASEKNVREFVEVCNGYLSGKELVYDNVNYKIFIRPVSVGDIERNEVTLQFSMLSSGEKQIVSLFSHIYLSGELGYFVIIDEPELSLSVPWQRRFLPDILSTHMCKGLLAVTHSPFIWENELELYTHAIGQFVESLSVVS